jgi:DNA-binding NarL/FixJ family response regulator
VNRITLLLADDHPIVRLSVAAYMECVRDIYVIGEAADGYETLHLSEQLMPDVLLLDINMPGMNGIEVAQALRAQNSLVKILVFSAHADGRRVQAMLDNDVEGYLTKQEPMDQVLEAIRGIVRGECGYYSSPVKAYLYGRYTGQIERANDLTKREKEVLHQLITGRTTYAIAHQLDMSKKTVEKHLDKIYRKLDVSSRTGAVVAALQHDRLS